jgi:hypothetical protein
MLPAGHMALLERARARSWVLFTLALLGVVVEVGMGLFIHSELGQAGARGGRGATVWTVVLSLLGVAQAVAGLCVHRWLNRPASLLERLRDGLPASIAGGVPPELRTVVAIRATFLADVISWILLQLITLYGLLLIVITGRLWLLLTFAVGSLVLLARAAPSGARMFRLTIALHALD